jgi:hypothetical protein
MVKQFLRQCLWMEEKGLSDFGLSIDIYGYRVKFPIQVDS